MIAIETREVRHFHLACGLGGGAKGFNKGHARVGNMVARFRCIGGVDVDPDAARDFERLAGAPCTILDLFSREQYVDFHGREPPPGWRPATKEDLRRAAGGEHPHIVFASFPCKGFSGLLPEKTSKNAKYQALNRLTFRGLWLALEAWADDPVELIVFENVPRIQTRGRHFLDQIGALLRAYGYAVAETTHDCGKIGNLAQSRKRFLLVARHMQKVPPFLYQPATHPLRGVGEILERLPLPGDPSGGPMHRVPALQWKTWVRLAFVEAGSDWRSLNRLNVADGHLTDFGIVPELGERGWNGGVLGVRRWDQPSGVVTGNAKPTTGAFSVADPRVDGHAKSVQLGVRRWHEPTGVVTGKMFAGGGPNSVADPRIDAAGPRFNNVYRVIRYDQPAQAVTAGGGPSAGGLAVADPRAPASSHTSKYRVTRMDEATGVVISASTTGQGAFAVAEPRCTWADTAHRNKLKVTPFEAPGGTVTGSTQVGSGALCVADPRPECFRDGRQNYMTAGHFGVVPWDASSGAVTASGQHDNGRWSVADPRPADGDDLPGLPAMDDRLVAVIRAHDGTWHRPFTTLELAALQSLVDPEEYLELEGLSDSAWRERIGNAVPPDAAKEVGSVMGRTLLLAWSGETFMLSSEPIWVRPVAVALAVDVPLLLPLPLSGGGGE